MFKAKINARKRAIFAACKHLGIDEDERRQVQLRVVGKASLSDMKLPELDDLLDHLNAKARGGYPGTPANLERKPYLWKIEALLADMGLPWSYAEKVAQNITGGKKPEAIKRLAWVKRDDHFRGIIAALDKQHGKRLEPVMKAFVEAMAARGVFDWTEAAAWARERIQSVPGTHTAGNHWADTIQTLERLTALAKKP